MPTAVWIVIVVVVVIAAVLAALAFTRKRATEQLKERFGPEYDRTVTEEGDKKDAERKLADIADKRDQLDIRPLTTEQREEYARRWEAVQVAFVDQPGEATDDADALITEVMRTRGYPVDDFESRADLMAADHPGVVEHYRAAHAAHAANAEHGADTEQLRAALVHYRALFEQLIDRAGTRTEETAAEHAAAERPAVQEPVDEETATERPAAVRTESEHRATT